MHRSLAHLGTSVSSLVSLLAVAACSTSHDVSVDARADARPPEARVSDASVDAGADGAAPSTECSRASDCLLVPLSCCTCPYASESAYRAEPGDAGVSLRPQTVDCGGVACGGCRSETATAMLPAVRADCIEHRCQVVNVRTQPRSACTTNAQCSATPLYCRAESNEVVQWVGISDRAAEAQTCLGISPGPGWDLPHPLAFCSYDGHCSVRRPETVDGGVSSECFSPDQNAEAAFTDAGVPCDCVSDVRATACVAHDSQLHVLACEGGRWKDDGDFCYLP